MHLSSLTVESASFMLFSLSRRTEELSSQHPTTTDLISKSLIEFWEISKVVRRNPELSEDGYYTGEIAVFHDGRWLGSKIS